MRLACTLVARLREQVVVYLEPDISTLLTHGADLQLRGCLATANEMAARS